MLTTVLDLLGLSKTTAKVIGYALLVAGLAASHTFVYFEGKDAKEAEYVAANIEQIQKDAINNAENIESQITRLNEATARLRRQAEKVEGAIDANEEVNFNLACSTSDDELREFNEAISQASRGLPDRSDK